MDTALSASESIARIANGKHNKSGRTTIPAVTCSRAGTPGEDGAENELPYKPEDDDAPEWPPASSRRAASE